MKKITSILIIFFISACSFGDKNSERIVEKLESEGKPYFDYLVSAQQYESLLDKIENGDEILIQSSSLLSKWVDASTSLSLKYSLSRAITKNPDAVMKLIPEFFSASDVCTIPYIEAPKEIEMGHVHESLFALENSDKSSYGHAECIALYRIINKNITKSSTGR